MKSLLVLGSKPGPILPPAGSYDDLACANASGRSAALLGLGRPTFTAMSAIITSGHKPANDLALAALKGLRTGSVYFYRRPPPKGGSLSQARSIVKHYRMSAWYFRHRLRGLGYRWDEFRDPGHPFYDDIYRRWLGDDPKLMDRLARKRPSTGMLAVMLGVDSGAYSRIILAGFSFEITHAYADNPLVELRGARSLHADTDIAMLSHLARKLATILTTEPIVSDCTGVPLLTEVLDASRASSSEMMAGMVQPTERCR
jgi:hypothetical protein